MDNQKLKEILEKHLKWVNIRTGGEIANLRSADLRSADLHSANLRSADLRSADLHSANLRSADLRSADLRFANLRSANLRDANLSSADLRDANLSSANLRSADLRFADLRDADLSDTNLSSANLSSANLDKETIKNINKYRPFQICPQDGEFIAWKKGDNGCLIKILIPSNSKRTSSLIGRKCRASKVKVLAIWDKDGKPIKQCGSWNDSNFIYCVGKVKKPDSYDPDIRVECSHGIHFFITREEAEIF